MVWYVYMLRCSKGALYTGITTNVEVRLQTHNSGRGSKALKALGLPARLAYLEKRPSKSDALKREAALKKLPKSEKETLSANFRRSASF